MLPTTIEAANAILRADPTVAPAERVRLVALFRNPVTKTTAPTETRIMRRSEVAKVLSRSTRAVDLLAEQGHLRKVRLPGRTRAGGFLASDVYALIGAGGDGGGRQTADHRPQTAD